ncbi:hypothetical protein LJC40_04520, partial [Synergistaceae bacterium OttesenSCG-928-D05]|nr:hypothetical protein [Synergistaceae bacterium OttesenSCG-928-D05]
MKKLILLCAIIGVALVIALPAADAKTINDVVYGNVTLGLATGDTIDVSNTTSTGVPHYFGVYAVNYETDFSAIDNVTVKSSGYTQKITGQRVHGDAIRTNNLYTSTGVVKIGNGWTLETRGYSADGVNLSGFSRFIAGDNLIIRTELGAVSGIGDSSYGLRANHSNKMTIGKSLDITTMAEYSHGIYMNYALEAGQVDTNAASRTGSEISIDQYSKITTDGNHASAARIISSGDKLYVQGGAKWTTNGTNGHVLYIASSDNIVQIGDNSTLKSTNTGAHVININGAKNANITLGNQVSLITEKNDAYGIYVNGNGTGATGKVALGSDSAIETSGNTAYGVYMRGIDGIVEIGNRTSVSTTGTG